MLLSICCLPVLVDLQIPLFPLSRSNSFVLPSTEKVSGQSSLKQPILKFSLSELIFLCFLLKQYLFKYWATTSVYLLKMTKRAIVVMRMMTTANTNIIPASTRYRVSLLITVSLLHSSCVASCIFLNAAIAAADVVLVDDFFGKRICFLARFLSTGSDRPRNVSIIFSFVISSSKSDIITQFLHLSL